MSGVGLGAGCWSGGLGGIGGTLAQGLVGFPDASQTNLSILGRTVTISPVGTTFEAISKGIKFTFSSAQSVTFPNSTGLHFIYFDLVGNLTSTMTFVDAIITEYAFVSVVYWDAAANKHIYFADERHGIRMETLTHLYLHNTQGAKFDNGLALTGFLVDGTGNLAADAQFTSLSGRIWDEDLKFQIPAQPQFPVLYRSGSQWKRKEADSFPVIYAGKEGYTGIRLPYNRFSGGVWDLAEVDSNKFVLVHLFATNDKEFPVFAMQGQAQYISKSAAQSGAQTELQGLTGLPFAEFVPIGSVIYETQNSYTNAVKGRVVSTSSGAAYEDKRTIYFRPGTL